MTAGTAKEYRPLDEAGIRAFIAGTPDLAHRLGGSPSSWRVSEVGDGNLNLVFPVDGAEGSICVKQSLPYVRAAGESWPMPLERTYFEQAYYARHRETLAGLVPEVLHYDPVLFAIVMERLSPHIILRRGLIEGRRYPKAAAAIGTYIARQSFFSSDLGLRLDDKFDGVAAFAGNNALRRITAELVFADPFVELARNRWTSPELDGLALDIRADRALKLAVANRGHQFLTSAEALIHGDLHTGSIMVIETDTRVIDPEFAVYGPVGFDLGAFLANLLMNFFSQPGHATDTDDRHGQQAWLLEQVPIFWDSFATTFRGLVDGGRKGDAFPAAMFATEADRRAMSNRLVERYFADMVGFAGAKTIRRVFGFAHNADFELIADRGLRARLEGQAVALARELLVRPSQFRTPADIVTAAKTIAG